MVGTDTWTTLPDTNGKTQTGTGAGTDGSCGAGWVEELHPFLAHYMNHAWRAHRHHRLLERGNRFVPGLATLVLGPDGVCRSAGRAVDQLRE